MKRGGSNQSKESVELELQRGFVAWRNEGRLTEQWGRSFSEAVFESICAHKITRIIILDEELFPSGPIIKSDSISKNCES